VVDLYGNQADASWAWTTASSSGARAGARFQVTEAGNFTRVGFYRIGTGTGPRNLALYDAGGGLLFETASPTDSETTGWQWTTLPTPVTASTGVTYTVAYGIGGFDGRAINDTPASRAAAPTPFIFDDTVGWSCTTSATCFPNTAVTTRFYGAGVTWEGAPEPPPGPGEGDPTTTGDLNSWLSALASVNTHKTDGLPWLTKEQLNAIEAAIALIPKAAGTDWTRLYEIWQFAGDLTDVQLGLWRAFMDRGGSQLTGPSSGGGSAFFSPGGIQVSSGVEDSLHILERLEHRMQTTNWLVPLGDPSWEQTATTSWSGTIDWAEPADVYVCHITGVPAWADTEPVAPTVWYPRAAWWTPRTGGASHERRFCDMELQLLHALPMRCEGILFHPRAGYSGILEAWVRQHDPGP
jgi:Domain of unknown function (DUF4082)